MDVLLRCSKWLLGAWLDLHNDPEIADWSSESNEPAPLSLWHCDPELCSIEKRFNWKDGPFHGPSYTIESQWGKFEYLPPPQGCNFYPILRYGLTEPASLFKCGKFHISVKSTLWATRRQIFFAMLVNGQIWDAPAPQGCNFYPILRYGPYRACQPLQVWWFIRFYEIPLWATTRQSFPIHWSMGLFGRLFALGRTSYPRSAYKSHSTRFPIRPHVLTPHSWLCDKNCGRSSAPK